MKKIAFSVIMPVYNRRFCICQAIDSLLAQTFQNFELIIVDDGSVDDTESLLKERYKTELADGKIVYCYTEHVGVCRARNLGLQISRNPWIAYLDSDNTVVSEFLQVFAEAIAQSSAKTYYAQIKQNIGGKIYGHSFNFKSLLYGNYIDMGAFVHSRALVDELGGFDENMTRVVDWELIVRYTRKHKPVFIPKIVVNYNDSTEHMRISTTANAVSNTLYLYRKHIPKSNPRKAPILGFMRYSVPCDFAAGRDAFDEEYMEYRYRIFKDITLKSLDGQTDKNFNLVILHSEDLPQNYKDRFTVLEYKYPFLHNMYLKNGASLTDLMRQAEQTYLDFSRKILCTFRLDNDDALPRNFVATLRQYRKPQFAGYALSLPQITLVQRCSQTSYLTYEWCCFSNSIGLACISSADNFCNIMEQGHHGRVVCSRPLLALPIPGGLQTINGENIANRFPKPAAVEKLSEKELKKRLEGRFPDFNLWCLKIFSAKGKRSN